MIGTLIICFIVGGIFFREKKRKRTPTTLPLLADAVDGHHEQAATLITCMRDDIAVRYAWSISGARRVLATTIDVWIPPDFPLVIDVRPRAAMSSSRPIADTSSDLLFGHPVSDVLYQIEAAPRDVVRQLLGEPMRKLLEAYPGATFATEESDSHHIVRLHVRGRISTIEDSVAVIDVLVALSKRALMIEHELDSRSAPAMDGAPYRPAPTTAVPEAVRRAREREVAALLAKRQARSTTT